MAEDRASNILNRIGVQNGVTHIANLVPMIEIGIVEPSIVTNTTGNLKEKINTRSILENIGLPYDEIA
jgi:hypothetical protein